MAVLILGIGQIKMVQSLMNVTAVARNGLGCNCDNDFKKVHNEIRQGTLLYPDD